MTRPTREQVKRWYQVAQRESEDRQLSPEYNLDVSQQLAIIVYENVRADLSAKIELLEAENELLRSLSFRDERDQLRQKLAESQAREQELREAMLKIATNSFPNMQAVFDIAHKAIDTVKGE